MSRRNQVNRMIFTLPPMRPIGRRIYRNRSLRQSAAQSTATQFFRNLDQLAAFDGPLSHLLERGKLRVLVAGCSMGCEAFTLAGYLRHRYPGLGLTIDANDINTDALAVAQGGVYCAEHGLDRPLSPLARALKAEMFEAEDGGLMRVVQALAQCVTFEEADVLDQGFRRFRDYDVVLGQNFMIHMSKADEARAFANLTAAARPGGALFLGGMHLDARLRLAEAHRLAPLDWNVRTIHEGDGMRRTAWPWHYWALEPIDHSTPDYLHRYATIFTKPKNV